MSDLDNDLGRNLLRFVDRIFGDSPLPEKSREILTFVNQKDRAVGILVYHSHEKAHPASIENENAIIWKTDNIKISVKYCVERLWVAKNYRRQGS